MSLMNKLARKMTNARNPVSAPVNRPKPQTTIGGRPAATTMTSARTPVAGDAEPVAGTAPTPSTPTIAGLTNRGSARQLYSRPAKKPKGLKYGGRI
jgi:hypothetical protein